MSNAFSRCGTIEFVQRKKREVIGQYSADVLFAAAVSDRLLAISLCSQSTSALQGFRAGFLSKNDMTLRGREGKLFAGFQDSAKVFVTNLEGKTGKAEKSGLRCLTAYADFDGIATEGFVPIFSDRPQEILFELAQRLDLPVLPHWSWWLVDQIRRLDQGFEENVFRINTPFLIAKVKRADCFRLISEGLQARRLTTVQDAPDELRSWSVRPFGQRIRDHLNSQMEPVAFDAGNVFITDSATNILVGSFTTVQEILRVHQTGAYLQSPVPDDPEIQDEWVISSVIPLPDGDVTAVTSKKANKISTTIK